MASPFTAMLEGTAPCHKLFENERFFSILEPSPLSCGHALVIPKKEIDYLFDLSEEELAELFALGKKIAAAIRKTCPCEKIAVMAYGLKVRHAHVHLIPVSGKPGELDFSNQKKAPDPELEILAQKIRRNIS